MLQVGSKLCGQSRSMLRHRTTAVTLSVAAIRPSNVVPLRSPSSFLVGPPVVQQRPFGLCVVESAATWPGSRPTRLTRNTGKFLSCRFTPGEMTEYGHLCAPSLTRFSRESSPLQRKPPRPPRNESSFLPSCILFLHARWTAFHDNALASSPSCPSSATL